MPREDLIKLYDLLGELFEELTHEITNESQADTEAWMTIRRLIRKKLGW